MEAELYAQLATLEDHHWWFMGRRRILQSAILRLVSLPRPARILDAGCGTGGNLAMLSEFGSVVGLEMVSEGAKRAHGRQVAAVCQGRLPDNLPFPGNTFDLAVALDVLEHLDDDEAALQALRALVKPGGSVLLTVPAFSFLWSHHDEVHHHRRRYTLSEVARKLVRAGLRVDYGSYFNTCLFPVVTLVRLCKSKLKIHPQSSDLSLPARPANALLRSIFGFERHLIGLIRFPLGVSILAVGTKPS